MRGWERGGGVVLFASEYTMLFYMYCSGCTCACTFYSGYPVVARVLNSAPFRFLCFL